MTITRADVCRQARLWIDTPFQHQARMRGTAVDCAGLIIGVARELGMVAPDFDVNGYAAQPDGTALLRWCDEHMTRIEQDAMQPGDVVVVAFDGRPQHMGFVVDYPHGGALGIVHALSHAVVCKVVEHRLMFSAAMQFRVAYRLPGIAD